MRRLELAKAFDEEDRRITAVRIANSPQAQLAKRISDETGKDIYEVAINLAKERTELINPTSSVDDRADA